jgi:hypothetical protein
MKDRVARRASLIVLGALLLLVIPVSSAFALATISSVNPPAEPRNVTTDLKIIGNAFSTLFPPTVDFGPGITVNTVNVDSGSQLTVNVTITANAPTGVHTVTVDDGLGSPSSCMCFTVTAPPSVTSIAPPTIGLGAGTKSYIITGTNFITGATAEISGTGVTVAHPVVTNPTTMTVDLTISSMAVPGARNITVTNPDNQFATCAGCFTVTPAPRATSSGFSPAQRAPGLTGQVITIIGTGFASGIQVTFAGAGITAHNPATFVNSTRIQVTIDTAAGAPLGPGDVTFLNTDGGTSTCANCFAITGPTTVVITTPSTVNGSVVATFSQPVSGVSSTNSYLRVTGQASNLASTITCADGNGFPTSCSTGSVKTAFLRASSLLTSGQDYTVTIAATGTSPITDFGGSTVAQTTKDFRGGLIQQAEGPASTSTWRLAKTLSAYGGSFVIDHTAGATASYGFRGSSIIWYTSIGPSYGIADLYVDGVLRATVNSYSPTTHYRAAFTVVGLGSASHTLTIRVRGARGSSHGTGTDVAVDAFKTGRTLVTSPTLTYTWGTVKVSAASGGVYIQSNEARSTTSFTFRSTSVEWDTVVGPAMGRASVYVDGVLKATFDNYSSTYHYGVARIFSGLSDSVHTLKILVLGTHRSTSTGSWIVIDRWVVT